MEMFIPFGEVFLAAAVHASLQLELGGLLLLYHASLGKHIRRRTKKLVNNYIAGIGTLAILALTGFCFMMDRYFGSALYPEELAVVVGMLVAIAVLVWIFYYRRGRSTELWLPRSVARYINRRAKNTDSSIEAFSLGVLTSLAEMPFTLILLLTAANSILALPFDYQLLAAGMYVAVVILPMIILRLAIRRGQTVADIQRWRVKHKNFFRIMTGVGFLALALFILAFEVLV